MKIGPSFEGKGEVGQHGPSVVLLLNVYNFFFPPPSLFSFPSPGDRLLRACSGGNHWHRGLRKSVSSCMDRR